VRPGARQHLLTLERQRFLDNEWPPLRQRLRRLGLSAKQLEWED
jgi:GntR family transcriptional regulator